MNEKFDQSRSDRFLAAAKFQETFFVPPNSRMVVLIPANVENITQSRQFLFIPNIYPGRLSFNYFIFN